MVYMECDSFKPLNKRVGTVVFDTKSKTNNMKQMSVLLSRSVFSDHLCCMTK